MKESIRRILGEHHKVIQEILDSSELQDNIALITKVIVDCFRDGGKVLFCGNGGSAADAQHLAGELSGRFYIDRKPLFAEALNVNTAYLTAVANDYGFDQVFSRILEAKGRKGDVIIALSTSGNSANIISALEKARSLDLVTIGFTGSAESKMLPLADYSIRIPSTDTPRIQEGHMLIGHIICALVEQEIFGK